MLAEPSLIGNRTILQQAGGLNGAHPASPRIEDSSGQAQEEVFLVYCIDWETCLGSRSSRSRLPSDSDVEWSECPQEFPALRQVDA